MTGNKGVLLCLPQDLTPLELDELRRAKRLLENPGLAARITSFIGSPIEGMINKLPDKFTSNLDKITEAALMKASDAAIFTIKDVPGADASNFWHKMGVAVCGGVGGCFGVSGLAAELPLSTTIMLRSIADIARSEGESIKNIETQMACLEVFAFGSKSADDDGAESGYYSVRYALAKSVTEAADHLLKKGAAKEAAPLLVKLISLIAKRFGIHVSQKAAAQAVPAIGAAGGAMINMLFINHFQDMARGHFIVRRLERRYGVEVVKKKYELVG